MELSRSVVRSRAEEYETVQPLSTVEVDHRELLPDMLSGGDFGWRDAEWVVQWYFRRFLGAYPDAERRATESAFGENSYEDVQAAIEDVLAADEAGSKLDALTDLEGVDVPVASAFLQFLHPDRYVVCSRREWSVLLEAGELDDPYPDPPFAAEYERYLRAFRDIADRCDCSLWTLYRAIWVLAEERVDRTGL